jgi:Phosphoadenosine phosphosulfate reductase family
MNKIIEAKRVIQMVMTNYSKPVLMCSFGKDSMVLLHLVREVADQNIPILFHRDPWFSAKYEFAEKVIRDWELIVFDYPPVSVSMWQGKSIVAFTNHYQIGLDPKTKKPTALALPKNIVDPEPNKPWLCGRRDFLNRPVAYFNYPWDVTLIAHKSSDVDQIAGSVPLSCDIKQNDASGPDAAFPLRHWTDEDVWNYTEEHSLPVQDTRYEKLNGHWTEKADKTFNSDYWHACIKCIDPREPKTVHCPLLDMEISNISDQVLYQDCVPDYCHANS